MQKSPWLSVWFSPKTTIRKLSAEPKNKRVLILTLIAGVNYALSLNYTFSEKGIFFGFPLQMLVLLLSPLFIFLTFSLASAGFYCSGRLLKGSAKLSELVNIAAWASVPSFFGLLFYSAFYALSAMGFYKACAFMDNNLHTLFSLLLMSVSVYFWISFLSEIQGFSIKRSIASYFLGFLCVVCLAFAIVSMIILLFMGVSNILS